MSEFDNEVSSDTAKPLSETGERYSKIRGISVEEVAAKCGGTVSGNTTTLLFGVSAIDAVKPGTLSFFNGRSAAQFANAPQPSAVLVTAANAPHFHCDRIIVDDPYLAYARVSALFDSARTNNAVGIDPTAIVHPDVLLDDGVIIGPFSVVGASCRIGKDTQLGDM